MERKRKPTWLLWPLVFLNLMIFWGEIIEAKHHERNDLNMNFQHLSEKQAKDALNQALWEKRQGVKELEAELNLADEEGEIFALDQLSLRSDEEEDLPAHQRVLSLLKGDRPFAVQCFAALSFLLHLTLFLAVPHMIGSDAKDLSADRLQELAAERLEVQILMARRALLAVLVRQAVALAVKGRKLAVAIRSQPWDRARKAIRNLSLDPAAQYLYYSAIFLAFVVGASTQKLKILGVSLIPLAIREVAFTFAALTRLASTIYPGLKDWYYRAGYIWFGPNYKDMTQRERSIRIGKTVGQITFLTEVWVTVKLFRSCMLSTPPNIILLVAFANFIRVKCFLSPKVQEAILEMVRPATKIVLALFSNPKSNGQKARNEKSQPDDIDGEENDDTSILDQDTEEEEESELSSDNKDL